MNQSVKLRPILDYQEHISASSRIIEEALSKNQSPVTSTKFGPESSVFMHLINQHYPNIPILWVDTGYNTRATLEFVEILVDRLNLNLCTFKPLNHSFKIPPTLDDRSHATFTQQVKLEPFQRALESHHADVWFSSIRRYQSTHRQQSCELHYRTDGLLKASPILNWSEQTVEQYRQEHNLPIGPECYDPTKGIPFRECGIHNM